MKVDSGILLYMRISKEEKKNGVSDSIASQTLLLRQFIDLNQEWGNRKRYEVVDDGYSGTNFKRPGIAQMIQYIEEKKVDTIIVKDFSRFGRDYLAVGSYIEDYFPKNGIRFLAVTEQFDSVGVLWNMDMIEAGFRQLVAQMYSYDLSEKVRSIQRMRAKEGKFVTAIPPYGYQRTLGDKNQLAIQPESAKIVRKVFDMALSGMGVTQIARCLNQEKILTPAEIRGKMKNEKALWSPSTIYKMLRDIRYTGSAVYGKQRAIRVGSKQMQSVEEKDWIVVSDTHEAIVSVAEFYACKTQRKIDE